MTKAHHKGFAKRKKKELSFSKRERKILSKLHVEDSLDKTFKRKGLRFKFV
jgi:hypothetical protein